MKVSVATSALSSSTAAAAVHFVYDDEVAALALPGALASDFSGKPSETTVLYAHAGVAAARYVLVGLGKRASASAKTIRGAVHAAVSKCKDLKAADVAFSLPTVGSLSAAAVAHLAASIAMLSDYAFDRYITDDKRKFHLSSLTLHSSSSSSSSSDAEAVQKAVTEAVTLAAATCYTRDVANTRGDECTPQYFEDLAKATAAELPSLKLTVLDDAFLVKNGMNLIHAVGKGAAVPPRIVLLEYNGNPSNPDKRIALVGKGITFDTGGLNLKPTGSIETMYMDCHGAATVLGCARAIATLALPVNVVFALACAENAIDANAIKPFEIVRSYKGTTVRIDNTDAEGRLVLADTLTYVQKQYAPQTIVDFATLTGACVIALGEYVSGLFCNDEKLASGLISAGEAVDERCWRMPLLEEYAEELKGKECDLHSMGKGRYGGACTAAAFLSHFVDEGRQWAHVDIAGTGMASAPRGYVCANGTGYGVQLVVKYLQSSM